MQAQSHRCGACHTAGLRRWVIRRRTHEPGWRPTTPGRWTTPSIPSVNRPRAKRLPGRVGVRTVCVVNSRRAARAVRPLYQTRRQRRSAVADSGAQHHRRPMRSPKELQRRIDGQPVLQLACHTQLPFTSNTGLPATGQRVKMLTALGMKDAYEFFRCRCFTKAMGMTT